MMDEREIRVEFESWAVDHGFSVRRRSTIGGDYYDNEQTAATWMLWREMNDMRKALNEKTGKCTEGKRCLPY